MKCGYPPCPVQIASGGENPPAFCEKHMTQKCLMPPCKEFVIPNSGWCKEHNEFVNAFDFIHGIRHQEAAQQMADAQRNEAIANKVIGIKGNGSGSGLILGRH